MSRAQRQLVQTYGEEGNWQQIAVALDGRTDTQCLMRYKRSHDPALRHGKWDWEEDVRLWLAVRCCVEAGVSWGVAAQFVRGRSDFKCREVRLMECD